MERKKYALSQDEGPSPDMCISSPKPIKKSKKVLEQVPEKKNTIMVDEYWERGEHKRQDKAQLDVECQEEEEEALQKLNEMRRLDQEDWKRMVKMKR